MFLLEADKLFLAKKENSNRSVNAIRTLIMDHRGPWSRPQACGRHLVCSPRRLKELSDCERVGVQKTQWRTCFRGICPLRHRFSQCIDFFGVQDLIRTFEELPDAGPMQFQLEPADPERTKGKLLLSSFALVGCLDPTNAERRLRIAVGD